MGECVHRCLQVPRVNYVTHFRIKEGERGREREGEREGERVRERKGRQKKLEKPDLIDGQLVLMSGYVTQRWALFPPGPLRRC